MIRYFFRALGAHFRSGRTLFVLGVAGVALGVGSVLSIQILNRSALGAFAGSVEAISGEADLSVLGTTPTFPETALAEVLATPGVAAAIPLLRIDVALERAEGIVLEVVGVDPFAPARLPWKGERGGVADPLAVPGWSAITPEFARERGLGLGDRFAVSIGSRRVDLRVGALVDFRRLAPLASSRLVVLDLSQAQARFGVPGALSQIDVVARRGVDVSDLERRLAARLGPGVRVATPEQRRAEAAGLMSAFRLNLTALSLISLFVGGFLVYASTQASLVRRREEIGLLRSIGATRGQVLGVVLGEVLLLGFSGTAVGLPLGWAAARLQVDAVSGTLQNLYLLERIESLTFPPWMFLLAAAMGLAGALAGALWPAIDLARRDPRALLARFTLEEPLGGAAGRLALAGGATLAAAIAWYATFGRRVEAAGFVVGVALLVAAPLSAPLVVRTLAARGHPGRFGVSWGVRTLADRLQTASVAVAALAVAVSMLFGITLMIESFRETVVVWLDDTVRADVYVTTPSWRQARSFATLDPEVLRTLERTPGVRAVDTLRQFVGRVGTHRVSVSGFASDLPPSDRRVRLMRGEPATAMARVQRDGAVLISEPLSRRTGLGVGGIVAVDGPRGPVRFPIAGVYYDYSTESGGVLMDLATFARAFGDGPVSNAALYLQPGVDAEATVDLLKRELAGVPLDIRSNRRLREEVLSIFDQTFAVTRLLQGMSLLIAVSGITLTLLVLARERAAEIALYRALGATRGQVFGVFVGKGVGMAAFGLLLGTAGGLGLAWVLIYLINRAYFGWTIQAHVSPATLGIQAGTIVVAAVLASLYPAARASRTPARELSRDAL